jgi:hypothetical protein
VLNPGNTDSQRLESKKLMKSNHYTTAGKTKASWSRSCIFFGVLLGLVMWQMQNQSRLFPTLGSSTRTEGHAKTASRIPPPYTCSFRNYHQAKERFYGLILENYPSAFLRSAIYIYGKPPILLPVNPDHHGNSAYLSQPEGKVCRRPSPEHLRMEFESDTAGHQAKNLDRPFMDGTNPSLISLERIRSLITSQSWFPWERILEDFPTAAYVVSSNFKKNHQCEYLGVREKQTDFWSTGPLPGRQHDKEADILIVDSHMRTLLQTTLCNVTGLKTPQTGIGQNSSRGVSQSADDGRLLVHDGAIWIAYKRYSGALDGHGDGSLQYMAQLRFQYDPQDSLPFRANTMEERAVCCGRNFAALPSGETDGKLSFLTWPDPVWVQSIDTRSSEWRYETPNPDIKSENAWGKKSGFHGTSGFLLHVPEKDEYLGIGHIHRERRWVKNKRVDAHWGHHYTHAFFTISSQPPYMFLKRLSQEFLFPSKVANFTGDADVVQFASGLEWVPGSSHRQVAIGYGINDCEGAVVYLDWNTIDLMLSPVANGTQVAHTMKNTTREKFARPQTP